MTINISINSIDNIFNEVFPGQLPSTTDGFSLGVDKHELGNIIKIMWSFEVNLVSLNMYIKHQSRTTYKAVGFTLDRVTPKDPRIEVLIELGTVALAHSRMMFIEQNRHITHDIPTFINKEALRDALFQQFQALCN